MQNPNAGTLRTGVRIPTTPPNKRSTPPHTGGHTKPHTQATPTQTGQGTGSATPPTRRHTMGRMRVCSTPDCPNLHPAPGRCPTCRAGYDRARRPHGNPYSTPGHLTFRHAVLTRDPICVACLRARATVADHHPHERRELIAQGKDPNDPQHGRGLCTTCHNRHTAKTASGW